MSLRNDQPNQGRRRLLKAGVAAAAIGALSVPMLRQCRSDLPPPGVWRNWSGSETSRPRAWLTPANEAELVTQLRSATGTVRVTGASHSFSALCTTDDTLFSLDRLTGLIRHDPQTLQATVWAGTRLRDLGDPLWQIGQGLLNQGDVNPQSVAGACGTSTHGTGITLGSLSAQVRGVRLLTPAGEIIEADAGHHADVFHAAGTSLGALGILTQVTLQNRAAYRLHEREFLEDLDTVLANIGRYARENRHFEFWAFFEADSAVVKVLNETEREPTPPPVLQLPVSAVLDLSSRIAHGMNGMDGPMQKLLTALHSPTDRVGRSHDIFPSERNSRFNEMEYELPVAQGPECLRDILHAVRTSGLRTLFPIEYRHVAADDVWLSPFQGRDSASISIHQHISADHRPLFALVEPIFWKYGGRPHWGKLHTLTARALAPLYPHWDDYQRVRARLDPQGRMLNAHLRRLLLA